MRTDTQTAPRRHVPPPLLCRLGTATLALAALACASGTSAATWTKLSDAAEARSEGGLLVHEGDVYTFNGFDGNIDLLASVERYDRAADRWTTVATTSASGSRPNGVTHNGLVLVGDEAWLIGGRIGDSPGKVTDRIWILDLERYTWREGPKLPTVFAAGGAALIGRKIHVFGGVDSEARCDVDTHLVLDLDDQGRGWRGGFAPLPNRRNHFGTVVQDGLIYALGGQIGHSNCSKYSQQRQQTRYVHRYDPATNQWQRLADTPWQQSHTEPSSFTHAGLVWSVGGMINGERIMTYDPKTNSWTDRTDLRLDAKLFAPGSRVFGNRLYVFGGGIPNVTGPRKDTRVTTVSWLSPNTPTENVDDVTPQNDDPADDPADDAPVDAPDDTPLADNAGTVHRINLGGSRIVDDLGRVWAADTSDGGLYVTTRSRTWSTTSPARVDGVDNQPPASVYASKRHGLDAEGIAWQLPVQAGEYEVRVYLAEMWQGAFSNGVRRFDIEIEGQTVASDVDPYRELGARTGGIEVFRVSSDAVLDLRLRPRAQYPAIQALEIVRIEGGSGTGGQLQNDDPNAGGTTGGGTTDGGLTGGSSTGGGTTDGSGDAVAQLVVDETEIDFGEVVVGNSASRRLILSNTGTANLSIDSLSIVADASSAFSVPATGVISLAPGAEREIDIVFAPSAAGDVSALLSIVAAGSAPATLVALDGIGQRAPDSTELGTTRISWRVNVGGDDLLGEDGIVWNGDRATGAATDDGYTRGGSNLYSTTATVTAGANLPPAASAELFRSERWSSDKRTGLAWRFPVNAGQHEVRLYFAEIYAGVFRDGARMFDIEIEGATVLEDLDVYAEAGARRGLVKTFIIDSDAGLDIALRHVTQNPALKAIEILECLTDCSAD